MNKTINDLFQKIDELNENLTNVVSFEDVEVNIEVLENQLKEKHTIMDLITSIRTQVKNTKSDYDIINNQIEQWNKAFDLLLKKMDERDIEICKFRKLRDNDIHPLNKEEKTALNDEIKKRKNLLTIRIFEIVKAFKDLIAEANNSINQLNEMHGMAEQNNKVCSKIFAGADVFLNNQWEEKIQKEKEEEERIQREIEEAERRRLEEEKQEKRKRIRENKCIIREKTEINMKRIIEEKKRKELELKAKMEAIGNLDNWKVYKYNLDSSLFWGMEVDVVLRAYKDQLTHKTDVEVLNANNSEGPSQYLDRNYSILSNSVKICKKKETCVYDSDIPWKLNLPYQAVRETDKEIAMCCFIESNYEEPLLLKIKDVQSDFVDKSVLKMAEIDLPAPNCTCVVIERPLTERHTLDKSGCKDVSSSVDSRVSLTVPPNAVKVEIPYLLCVQSMDGDRIRDIKEKNKTPAFNNLKSISPIISIESNYKRDLLKPATLRTSINNVDSDSKIGNLHQNSDLPKHSIKNEPVHVRAAIKGDNNIWHIDKNIQLECDANNNNDYIVANINNIFNYKLILYGVQEDVTNDQFNKIMDEIEERLNFRSIQFVIGQKENRPTEVMIGFCQPKRKDNLLKQMIDEGYVGGLDGEPPFVSDEFLIKERNEIQLKCDGNVIISDVNDQKSISFTYYSQMFNKHIINVEVKDKFAQKNKDYFIGYLKFSKVVADKNQFLCRAHVKLEKKPSRMIKSATLQYKFKPNDIVDNKLLKVMSEKISDNWDVLAKMLNIPKETVCRIKGNLSQTEEEKAYEILLKWIKNISMEKSRKGTLNDVLIKVNQRDLLDELYQNIPNNS